MIPNGFANLLDRFGIIVAVVVHVETEDKVVVGDRTALESDYVLRTLFDDLSVPEINSHLDGRILPAMAQQGKVCGIICKPTENVIVGMYYHDNRAIEDVYFFSKKVGEAIHNLWGGNQFH